MNNLPFVLWLIGWSLAVDVGLYLRRKFEPDYKPSDQMVIFEFGVWLGVGILLYRP